MNNRVFYTIGFYTNARYNPQDRYDVVVIGAGMGGLAGIEILDAGKRFGDPEVFRRVVLEDVALMKPAAALEA